MGDSHWDGSAEEGWWETVTWDGSAEEGWLETVAWDSSAEEGWWETVTSVDARQSPGIWTTVSGNGSAGCHLGWLEHLGDSHQGQIG